MLSVCRRLVSCAQACSVRLWLGSASGRAVSYGAYNFHKPWEGCGQQWTRPQPSYPSPGRCAQACWARVRPDNDRAARTAAAASATEDLLASVAVTDVRELARRQKAYVADRRAEGISESFARVRARQLM